MIWLIGAGPMAVEYSKVLQAMGEELRVFGRSEQSAAEFTRSTEIPVQIGGANYTTAEGEPVVPDAAIVAVSPDQLAPVTSALLEHGVSRILLEKPGALNYAEISSLLAQAERANADIVIAYNRRFFESTRTAREIIEEDGGVLSFNFEITEWAHVIGALEKPKSVLEAWFLANTTHVVDLAWFLGGFPEEIRCYHSGSLDWHPSASMFTGAGISRQNAIFSYCGNWQAPGRWGLEFCTRKHKLIFRPMEQLRLQKIGSITIEQVELNNEFDIEFKPGLYRQTESFLAGDLNDFCKLTEQVNAWPLYERMAGYQNASDAIGRDE